jgi:energy-coupling factor transporter ATP-binding protein EcfA2/uncharacterized membrane protein
VQVESYKIENLSFTYSGKKTPAICDINLVINNGEFITICGRSGSGKSTLLRQLKPQISPAGDIKGKVFFEGKDLKDISKREQCEKIGFVMQNPESQIVTDKVWHELAFGPESLGMDENEIRARAAEIASFLGIEHWFYKNTSELSGGQKQILNLASVLITRPSVIILDEPTSQLDPIAASEFLSVIHKINIETGMTVIMTEHRLEEAAAISDKIAVMEDGKIKVYSEPREAAQKVRNNDIFLSFPTASRIFYGLGGTGKSPLTVREGRKWIEEYEQNRSGEVLKIKKKAPVLSEPVIEVKKLWFRYEKNSEDILKDFSITVHKGEIYAINGGNGTGKTTALSVMSGLKKPYMGSVKIKGKISMLPQNPQIIFLKKTLLEDFYDALSDIRISENEKAERIGKICSLCKISHILNCHPYDISGGEQQRAAIAKLLLREPDILMLDEPTKGLDGLYKKQLAYILKKLTERNVTIVIVSHDTEFCAEYADRCGLLFDGRIVSEGEPHSFFSGKTFYTTPANRIAKDLIFEAVTVNDIISAYGFKTDNDDYFDGFINDVKNFTDMVKDIEKKPLLTSTKSNKLSTKRLLFSALTVFALIPLTILFGKYFLGDRKYYFISLIIILEIMFPFIMNFEKRRPKAREISIIAVMCAIAVASRAAFYSLPQVKPACAVIIITGLCFGAETGFLTGAVTAFVSNMFFGQGPWTPWQMLAFGLVGFSAGFLREMGLIGKTKTGVCIFGILSVLVLYGGIMNISAVFMAQNNPVKEMFFAAFLSGFPFDLIHAVSTAVFLWIAVRPFTEKIERIKVKYDL